MGDARAVYDAFHLAWYGACGGRHRQEDAWEGGAPERQMLSVADLQVAYADVCLRMLTAGRAEHLSARCSPLQTSW